MAVGNFEINKVIKGFLPVAKDQTRNHELNKRGLGTFKHSNGWGAAYLQDGQWIIKKSLAPIYKDENIKDLQDVKTNLLILHARKSTKGKETVENTHPFFHSKDEDLVFCHNGTIRDSISHDETFSVKGETDSEKLFYSLLTDLEKSISHEKTILENLNRYQKITGTNIILSSKEKTIVAFRKTKYPKYYEMALGKKDNCLIISSEVLPYLKEELVWEKLPLGGTLTVDHNSLEVSKTIF